MLDEVEDQVSRTVRLAIKIGCNVAIAAVCWWMLPLGLFCFAVMVQLLQVNWYKPISGGSLYHSLRAKFGWGYSVSQLAKVLGTTPAELRNWSPKYQPHQLPKKSGGWRQLWIPDEATKQIQRRILRRILKNLKVHPAVHGFEKGKSIVTNARPHVGQAVVIKMDIVDFFDSTKSAVVQNYFQRIGWSRESARLLTRLTTHEGRLPQGAPTSPRMSSLVNYLLDIRLQNIADRRRCEYTRYADDITISMPQDWPGKVRGIIQSTQAAVRKSGYQLNQKKTKILRHHQRQTVTGLVVNTTVAVSRKQRKKLRAIAHRLQTSNDATMSKEQLQGWAAFLAMVHNSTKF
jgi:RNA-directed DNA polymerase